MHLLRKERHPLAVLGMLAMVMRIVIIVLGSSAATDPAAAGIFVTCHTFAETSTGDAKTPAGQPHDADHCVCGPMCIHGMHALAIPSKAAEPSGIVPPAAAADRLIAGATPPFSIRQVSDPIRGPPASLI